jgi:preprotein translocase subunit YajC
MTSLAALFQPSGAGATSIYPSLAMYALIFVIFYFILLRPQQQQRKKHEEEIRNVKKGDKIVTAGGVIGEIVFMKDDEITIRSGESKLIIDRGRIARIVPTAAPTDAG